MTVPYGKHQITDEDVEAVVAALRSDKITQGDYIEAFESDLCDYFGCNHAVAVNSGTMALNLIYRALDVDNRSVITTPNTFVATVNGIIENNGVPKLVDINSRTLNLSPQNIKNHLEQRSNSKREVAGITAVHFAGLPCDMKSLKAIADEYNLFLLEDACHAPGAEWHDGDDWIRVGSCTYADAATLSFHPVKHFTTGEGGAILTDNDELAESVRNLRTHGIHYESKYLNENDGPWYYEMQELGMNGRITDFQCALGIKQLNRLDKFLERRRQLAERYVNRFLDVKEISCQKVPEDHRHAYHIFTVRARDRDALFGHLQEHDISPQVHYIPVHYHPYYEENELIETDRLTESETYYKEAITLPLYPTLKENTQDEIIKLVKDFYASDS